MKVMQIGLGSIGKAVTRLLLKKPGWEVAAAFDIDPEKQGRDLGEVAGVDQRLGIPVAGDFLDFQQYGDVDVALVTTVSTLPEILPTLQALMQRGVNIVASAEELFYPRYRYPDEARKLDEMAKKYGVSILGTGVTPGFVMDTLVLMLTGMSQQINRLAVTRVVNASGSRPSLQQKIGIGLTEESFAEQEAQHRVGVVGLVDSLAFLAHVLQWEMEDFKERLVPVVTDRPLRMGRQQLEPKQVCGVRYIVKGISRGKEVISFDLRTYLEAENARNTIYIEGTPSLEMTIKSNDMGDSATAGLLVNMSPGVHQAKPGLLTALDLPLPHFQR